MTYRNALLFGLLALTLASCGGTSLWRAAKSGNITAVSKQLSAGTAADQLSPARATPLLLASEAGHTEIVKALIAAGADVNRLNEKSGFPALHHAAVAQRLGVVKVLLANGADPNFVGPGGTTAARSAINGIRRGRTGTADILKALAEHGADLDYADTDGYTVRSLLESTDFAKAKRAENPTDFNAALRYAQANTKKSGVTFVQNDKPVQGPTRNTRNTASNGISCGTATTNNLTGQQLKAVVFEFYRKTRSKSFICVDHVEVTDKFALRGNTVVKYVATVSFPNGYKTNCIGHRPQTGGVLDLQNFLKTTTGGCNPLSQELRGLGKPARPGERRTYGDEVTI